MVDSNRLIPSLDQSEKICDSSNVSSVISVTCVLAGVWDKKVQEAKARCACPIPTFWLAPHFIPLRITTNHNLLCPSKIELGCAIKFSLPEALERLRAD